MVIVTAQPRGEVSSKKEPNVFSGWAALLIPDGPRDQFCARDLRSAFRLSPHLKTGRIWTVQLDRKFGKFGVRTDLASTRLLRSKNKMMPYLGTKRLHPRTCLAEIALIGACSFRPEFVQ
jgi:hypothetical protein